MWHCFNSLFQRQTFSYCRIHSWEFRHNTYRYNSPFHFTVINSEAGVCFQRIRILKNDIVLISALETYFISRSCKHTWEFEHNTYRYKLSSLYCTVINSEAGIFFQGSEYYFNFVPETHFFMESLAPMGVPA